MPYLHKVEVFKQDEVQFDYCTPVGSSRCEMKAKSRMQTGSG